MSQVQRRQFLIAAGALFAAPLAAEAQQVGKKTVRIGYLATTPQPLDESFRQGLRGLGHVEGQNVMVEYRWGEGSQGTYADLAERLVRLNVDVIVAVGSLPTRAAKQATSTIPIVMVAVGDPVAYGFVPSLARPGGNITGLSSAISGIMAKGLQLLKEVVPKSSRVVYLQNPNTPAVSEQLLKSDALTLGLELQIHHVQKAEDFKTAFAAIIGQRPHALIISPDHLVYTQRAQIVEFALQNRLPAIYFLRAYGPIGGLMTLGPDRHEMYRRAATYVDKILKGAKPADLPVEQPTKFELVINLKTAKALGLTIPQSMLFRATEVIE